MNVEKMRELRLSAIKSGLKLLSEDEIIAEMQLYRLSPAEQDALIRAHNKSAKLVAKGRLVK